MKLHEFGIKNEKVLVLIHPSLVTWDYFEYVIPLLKDEYHVIIPAVPGYDLTDQSQFASVEDAAYELAQDLLIRGIREPDAIYGWDLAPEHRKPSPWALTQIMERYGFAPEQMLVVDDMKLAWDMASRVGVQTAFAAWGKLDFPEVTKEMKQLCDYSFDSTEELEKFLFE
jgi:beta-phosphoglucomutase-like phosphatase (HAD superfamily)